MDENALSEELSGDGSEDIVNGGVGPGDAEEEGISNPADEGTSNQDDPYGIKKRLGMQAKKHQREMRQLYERIEQMQSMMGDSEPLHNTNHYQSPGQPNPPGMTEEERIQHAVRLALGAKESAEREARDAERQAHVHKQYQRLNDEFDRALDKYDDFDEVVRGDDIPFSPHVRDALLLVENPAEVAYKLGKNRAELERISKLHPLDQAREVNKLSFSLMGGQSGKPQHSNKANPLGSIRTNPTSSNAITDKTPASVIRARMKAGTFK
jgi:hypothetical protein